MIANGTCTVAVASVAVLYHILDESRASSVSDITTNLRQLKLGRLSAMSNSPLLATDHFRHLSSTFLQRELKILKSPFLLDPLFLSSHFDPRVDGSDSPPLTIFIYLIHTLNLEANQPIEHVLRCFFSLDFILYSLC